MNFNLLKLHYFQKKLKIDYYYVKYNIVHLVNIFQLNP